MSEPQHNSGWYRGFLVGFALLLGNVACGPNPYDAYLAAMRAQGEAERGSCRLEYDPGKAVHTVNSNRIARCVRDLKEAQRLYEKARSVGYEGRDLDLAQEKIADDLRRIEEMLKIVSAMEIADTP